MDNFFVKRAPAKLLTAMPMAVCIVDDGAEAPVGYSLHVIRVESAELQLTMPRTNR